MFEMFFLSANEKSRNRIDMRHDLLSFIYKRFFLSSNYTEISSNCITIMFHRYFLSADIGNKNTDRNEHDFISIKTYILKRSSR